MTFYARQESRRILLVVGNLGRQEQRVKITLDLQKLMKLDPRKIKRRRVFAVREWLGVQEAKLRRFDTDSVDLEIEGHALALVEVVGPRKMR